MSDEAQSPTNAELFAILKEMKGVIDKMAEVVKAIAEKVQSLGNGN